MVIISAGTAFRATAPTLARVILKQGSASVLQRPTNAVRIDILLRSDDFPGSVAGTASWIYVCQSAIHIRIATLEKCISIRQMSE